MSMSNGTTLRDKLLALKKEKADARNSVIASIRAFDGRHGVESRKLQAEAAQTFGEQNGCRVTQARFSLPALALGLPAREDWDHRIPTDFCRRHLFDHLEFFCSDIEPYVKPSRFLDCICTCRPSRSSPGTTRTTR